MWKTICNPLKNQRKSDADKLDENRNYNAVDEMMKTFLETICKSYDQ